MKKVSRETFSAKQNVYHWIDTKIHRCGALKGKIGAKVSEKPIKNVKMSKKRTKKHLKAQNSSKKAKKSPESTKYHRERR